MGEYNHTENDTMEDMLCLQDSFLRKFADKMPGGFFIYHADEEKELIYANQALLRMFRCETMKEFKELTGNSFRGIVHPEDWETVDQSIKKQIYDNQYELDYVEYRIIPKGGGIRWVEDYGHFIHSEYYGDIFYVFLGDATEKKRRYLEEKRRHLQEKETLLSDQVHKEQQLQSQINEYGQELEVIQSEHLRHLEMIEGLSIDYESIFSVDLDNDRIHAYRVSQRFEKKFPKENRIGTFHGFDKEYIRDWVHPEDQERVQKVTKPDYIRKSLSANKTFHINYRVLRDGKYSYIQLRMVNVSSIDRVSRIVLGYRNIDDEIVMEMKQKQLLSEALEETKLANRAKDLFLSNMSHDIRTPMNAIVGFTELIKKHLHDKEQVYHYLDMLSSSSNQLLQLLNDVLEISRIESGKIQAENEDCNLMEVVQKVQTSFLSQAAAKNITLSLDLSNLDPAMVYTDRKKIKRILSCLVGNAVKYTNRNGQVRIAVWKSNELQNGHAVYQFIVEDNGIGMEETFLEHIFEPFEREKNTTLSGIHGTGLGLTIAKAFVEMMGGTIAVSSVVGEGSTFTVTLPMQIQKNQAICQEDIEEDFFQFSTPKRILLVDDNEINLEIENEVLKEVGFIVETAEDGSIAVEKVKQSEPGHYDLILMDIQMPIMNGYHATEAIRKLENPSLAGIPIIAVSANAFDEDKQMAMRSGMNAHLAKPLDTTRLFKLIRKFLKNAECVEK